MIRPSSKSITPPNMPTLTEIKAQIKNLHGLENFLGRKEINELPSILWHDETIENIVQGTYNNGNGILVATNRRLVFVDKGLLFGLKVEDFAYDKISSIQYETGLIFGKITIYTSGNKAVVDNVIKAKLRVFGDSIRAKISASKSPVGKDVHVSSVATDTLNVADQLERLAKLLQQGILTDEEFAAQKKKLLGL